MLLKHSSLLLFSNFGSTKLTLMILRQIGLKVDSLETQIYFSDFITNMEKIQLLTLNSQPYIKLGYTCHSSAARTHTHTYWNFRFYAFFEKFQAKLLTTNIYNGNNSLIMWAALFFQVNSRLFFYKIMHIYLYVSPYIIDNVEIAEIFQDLFAILF